MIGIINKPLFLHLVGVYIFHINDARSNKYQISKIEMGLHEVGLGGMDSISLAQDREKWRAVVRTAKNFRFHEVGGIFWVAEDLFASPEGLCYVNLVS